MEEAMRTAPAPEKSGSGVLRFECVPGCVACCTGGPGYVWLSEGDADRLAAHLGLSRAELLTRHCRFVDTGLGLSPSLNERADFSCTFLGKSGCEVYAARPAQCRTYPFWESILESRGGWAEEAGFCPGIGKGRAATHEEIGSAIDARRENPPICLSRNTGSGSGAGS